MRKARASIGFDGVRKIVRYNWPRYAAATLGIAVGLAAANWSPPLLRVAVYAAAYVALFWMLSSLLVSWYVYDLSELYAWAWLGRALGGVPGRWFHVHAGLDESSTALRAMYPTSDGDVIDIYDGAVMTEGSIARAQSTDVSLGKRRSHAALGLQRGAYDAGFLLFVAHELRTRADRRILFVQCASALAPGGVLVVVEHLRDAANVIAFGPGAFHFYSRKEWIGVGVDAGFLNPAREMSITPFVRCFVFQR